MVDGAELPQWVSYVGGAAGIIIATVIVRLGWNSKADPAPAAQEQGRLIGALVDSASVRELTLAIHSHADITKAGFEHVETMGNELRNLGDEVRRLANKVGDRT